MREANGLGKAMMANEGKKLGAWNLGKIRQSDLVRPNKTAPHQKI